MINQKFLEKIQSFDDDPCVIGRSSEDDAKDAWMLRFVAKMISVGLPVTFAIELFNARENNYEDDPEEAAQSELDAMDDGDLAQVPEVER